jgi:hypothetical protein
VPSVSIAQQHLMQAAEHGADFPMADKLRESMSHEQLHDFSVGSEADKPVHVAPPKPKRQNTLLHGTHQGVIDQNVKTLKKAGYSHKQALHVALKHSRKKSTNVGPNSQV